MQTAQGMLEAHRAKAKEKEGLASELQRQLTQTHAAMEQMKTQRNEANVTHEKVVSQLARANEKIEILNRRVSKLGAGAGASGGATSGADDALMQINEDLKHKLNCGVCKERVKSCMISKCSHVFCRQCVQVCKIFPSSM